jgi:hypothetical protein
VGVYGAGVSIERAGDAGVRAFCRTPTRNGPSFWGAFTGYGYGAASIACILQVGREKTPGCNPNTFKTNRLAAAGDCDRRAYITDSARGPEDVLTQFG